MARTLRSCTKADAQLLHDWRNSQDDSGLAIEGSKPTKAEHELWVENRLGRTRVEPFWIVEIDEFPVGYVRFDLKMPLAFTVSVLISANFQGRGVGYLALKESLTHLSTIHPEAAVIARVHKLNFKSLRVFEKLGFELKNLETDFYQYKLLLKTF